MNIFIVGGTSGIGEELARQYQLAGHRVGICGRDPNKSSLEGVEKYKVDVTQKSDIIKAIETFSAEGFDQCIFSVGVYYDSEKDTLAKDQVCHLINTNVLGLIHTFDAALKVMDRGRLVAIASVAAKHHTSLYAESKAAVLNVAEAYRRGLKKQDITVHTMLPGYVDTQKLRDLNKGDVSKKPFLVDVQKAAREIITAIDQKKSTYMFPKQMRVATRLLLLFPQELRNMIKKAVVS